jgi:hypothetical protein
VAWKRDAWRTVWKRGKNGSIPEGLFLLYLQKNTKFQLESKDFLIRTKNRSHLSGAVDILLSSVGWVLVSSTFDVRLKAYTPKGRGLGLRGPMHPYAVHMKGPRIPGTQFYKARVFLPE